MIFSVFYFSREELTVAETTVKRFNEKITAKVHRWWNRFYESGFIRRSLGVGGLTTVEKMKGKKTLTE